MLEETDHFIGLVDTFFWMIEEWSLAKRILHHLVSPTMEFQFLPHLSVDRAQWQSFKDRASIQAWPADDGKIPENLVNFQLNTM